MKKRKTKNPNMARTCPRGPRKKKKVTVEIKHEGGHHDYSLQVKSEFGDINVAVNIQTDHVPSIDMAPSPPPLAKSDLTISVKTEELEQPEEHTATQPAVAHDGAPAGTSWTSGDGYVYDRYEEKLKDDFVPTGPLWMPPSHWKITKCRHTSYPFPPTSRSTATTGNSIDDDFFFYEEARFHLKVGIWVQVLRNGWKDNKVFPYWCVGVLIYLYEHGKFQYVSIQDNPRTSKLAGFPRNSFVGQLEDGSIRIPKDQFTAAELSFG